MSSPRNIVVHMPSHHEHQVSVLVLGRVGREPFPSVEAGGQHHLGHLH